MRLPRLNAISFWLIPLALLLVLSSALVDRGPGTRWTLYPPLRTEGHRGIAVDIVILGLHCAGVRSLLGAINFLTTIHTLRRNSVTLETARLFI